MLNKFFLNRRLYWIGLLLLCCIGSAALGWRYVAGQNEKAPSEVTAIDHEIRIAPNTEIEQTYYYRKCKDNEVVKLLPDKELVGLDYEGFQRRYDKWNIELFNDEKIVMSIQVDDFCREHKASTFLGVKDGYVAVFYGKPDKKPVLKEMTNTPLANLHPQAAEEIKRGLPFTTKAEMLYILEGMQSK